MTSSKKLTRDLYLLIAFDAFRAVSDLFLGAFFVAFVMQLSANEIVSVSAYKLFEYVATCAGFFLFANWVKRYNKVVVFAFNLLPKILILLSIIILGNAAIHYVIPLGMLYGISAALYHLPRHAMTIDKVPSRQMGHFIGTKNAISYMAKIIAPVALGCFIDATSYVEIAYVLLFFALLEILLVCLMTPCRHRSNAPVDFRGFFRCMMRFPVVRKLFVIELFRGFSLQLLVTVIAMYTVYIFKTDLNLGILTTVFSLCSVATCWLMRYMRLAKSYRWALWISAWLIFVSMLLFVCNATPITFLLYNLVYATAIVFVDQVDTTNVYRLSKTSCITQDNRVEYFVFRDFALFIGRWIGFTGLMYVGVFGGYDWLRWYLVVICVALIAWCVLSASLLRRRNRAQNIHKPVS